VFTSIGQLVGAALVGALVASHGGGTGGFGLAFLVVGGVMLALALVSLGLKGRHEELATVRNHETGLQGRQQAAGARRAADG
jgi:hypothetical protein